MSRQVDEDVVVLGDRVGVGGGSLASSLEVLAVGQAGVDVVVAQRDGAQSLEIEIEDVAVDL